MLTLFVPFRGPRLLAHEGLAHVCYQYDLLFGFIVWYYCYIFVCFIVYCFMVWFGLLFGFVVHSSVIFVSISDVLIII